MQKQFIWKIIIAFCIKQVTRVVFVLPYVYERSRCDGYISAENVDNFTIGKWN